MAQITFKQTTNFTGRNGYMKCSGIDILECTDTVMIAPLTSKGNIGRCDITVPYESIPDLIEQLKAIKAP